MESSKRKGTSEKKSELKHDKQNKDCDYLKNRKTPYL